MISEECQGPLLYAHGDWGHFDLSSWLGPPALFCRPEGLNKDSLSSLWMCDFYVDIEPVVYYVQKNVSIASFLKDQCTNNDSEPMYSFISYSISYPFGAFVPIKHPSFAGFIQFPLWSCRERIVTGMALESCDWEGKSHLGSLLKVNPTWQSVRWNCIFILEM